MQRLEEGISPWLHLGDDDEEEEEEEYEGVSCIFSAELPILLTAGQ